MSSKYPNNDNGQDNNDDYEIIDETEMKSVNRGRKSSVEPELIELIKKLPKGKAILLKKYSFNDVTNAKEYGKHKAKIAAQIRGACKALGKTASFNWTADGTPQVSIK